MLTGPLRIHNLIVADAVNAPIAVVVDHVDNVACHLDNANAPFVVVAHVNFAKS